MFGETENAAKRKSDASKTLSNDWKRLNQAVFCWIIFMHL